MPSPKDPNKREEYRQKMILAARKLWDTPDLRDKTVSSMKKKKLSEEHKRKIGDAGKGEKNPNYGKSMSEEQKQKLRKKRSKESCNKIRVARLGKTASEDTRAKYRLRKQQLAKDPDYIKRNSESVILAKNEIWYGGVRYFSDDLYCELWTEELRERCRAYFGYVCVECGTPQNGRKLSVHHIHYNKKTCCDGSPRDLVPLCKECHGKTTSGDRGYWEKHFTEMLYGYYGGKSFFTKEEMELIGY
jgi:hypothetical protein